MSKAKPVLSLIIAFLSISIATSMFQVNLSWAQDPRMFVDPANIIDEGMGPCSNFTLTINVSDLIELYTWQIEVWFDPSIIECMDAYTPAGHVFEGKMIVPVAPDINNVEGYVNYGATLLGADSVTVDQGFLCAIDFHVIGTGSTDLSLDETDSFLLNADLLDIPAIIGNGFFSNVPTPFHDVAVVDLSLSDDRIQQNDSVSIDVRVLNNGTLTETFDVQVSYDGNLIGVETVTSLAAGDDTVLNFNWNTTGVPVGSYTVTAEAEVVTGETNIANNVKTKGIRIYVPSEVSTDLSGPEGVPDGKVDMYDVGAAARDYGSYPGHPRWNDGRTDINGDGSVNLFDIALVAHDFGTLNG
ncbi:MAG: CARDB domain-containing protein [Candidatus Bathyarchaeota archaeon]|jgi:hypothetical protein